MMIRRNFILSSIGAALGALVPWKASAEPAALHVTKPTTTFRGYYLSNPPLIGKTKSAIRAGESGIVTVWNAPIGGKLKTTDRKESCRGFTDIEAGKLVMIHPVNGRWVVTAVEC